MHAAEAVSSPLSALPDGDGGVTDRATRGACSAGSGIVRCTTSLGLRPSYDAPITVSDLCGVEPLRDGQAHQVIFVKVELEQDVQPPARRPPHAAGSNIGWGPVASCPWPACEAIIRRPAGVPARSMYRHTAVCGPGMTRLIAPSAAGVRHRRSNVLSTSGETQKGPRKKTRRGRPMTIAAKGTQRMPLLSPRLVANPSSAPTFRQPRGCKRPH